MTKAEEVLQALAPMFRCPVCGELVHATRVWEGLSIGRRAAGDCRKHGGLVWDKHGDITWWPEGQPKRWQV